MYGVFVRSGPGARWRLLWIGPRPAIYATEAAATDARRGQTASALYGTTWNSTEYEVAPVLVDARLRQREVDAIRKRRLR